MGRSGNVVAEEITEHQRAQAGLIASETKFRELADNISQFAWTADAKGWIYWYNRRWHDYTGTTLEEMQGWGWQKVHHPEHVDRVVQRIRESFEHGTPWEDTFPLRSKDGTYRWFLSRALPIRNEAGEVIRWFGTNTDVTEQIEAENALRESETRFRELADNISQFAWTADAKGWIYWYNKRWHDYAGTTLEDMQGWGWQKVHHPEHVDRVVQRIRQSFENGTPWDDTFPLRGKDGTYRWFLSRALPIRNEAGEVVRWFGTNTDVTEQIKAEQALRDLNETLEQRVEAQTRERARIWEVSQDLLGVCDMEGKYVAVNPAWSSTLGWSEADLLGESSQWLIHPDDEQKTRTELARLGTGRNTLRFESRFRHKDGSYRRLSWTAVPDQGLIYAVARDITELRDAEDKLRVSQEELARVNRQTTMGAMTASIAHEINQPLSAIVMSGSAALRFLARPEPDLDEIRMAVKSMVEDGQRAGQVIASIRAMFGRDRSERTEVNVDNLVREVIAIVHSELERQRISVSLDLQKPLPAILGDRVQLLQVLLNLILNAIEAMVSVKSRARTVTVKARPHGPHDVLVEVEDSGAGIRSGDLGRIFDAFFTTKSNGMGMGLAICRSIIESHGGSLTASANNPYGMIFQITLPRGDS